MTLTTARTREDTPVTDDYQPTSEALPPRDLTPTQELTITARKALLRAIIRTADQHDGGAEAAQYASAYRQLTDTRMGGVLR